MEEMVLYWSKNDNISQDCYRLVTTNKKDKYITMLMYEQLMKDKYITPKWLTKLPTLVVVTKNNIIKYEREAARNMLQKKIKSIIFLEQYNDSIEKRIETNKSEEIKSEKNDNNAISSCDTYVTKNLHNEVEKYYENNNMGSTKGMSDQEKHIHAINHSSSYSKSKTNKKVGDFSKSSNIAEKFGIKIDSEGKPQILSAKDKENVSLKTE